MGKWEKVRLGDVAKINMGQSPASETYNDIGKGLPFFQGKTDFQSMYPTIRMFCSAPQKTANKNDILMSVRAPVGVVNIATQNCCIGRGLAAISETENVSYYRYLFYYLRYKENDIANMGVGSTFKAISRKDINMFSIPLPPLKAQQKIADMLDKASALIELRKAQLDKLDLLIKSQFLEMFGDPVTNPMRWEMKKLGELCSISRGGSPRPIEQYLGGTVPWIKIGDATTSDDVYLHSTKEKIIEAGVKKSRLVKSGSLIFANCGVSLGFARIITFDGCIHDGWLSFDNINEQLDKIFLLKSLNQCTEYFRKLAPDGTQPNLNTGIMNNFLQIIPQASLQKQFSCFVESVDKSKFAIQQSLEKLELNYKSLMQKCFRGEIF